MLAEGRNDGIGINDITAAWRWRNHLKISASYGGVKPCVSVGEISWRHQAAHQAKRHQRHGGAGVRRVSMTISGVAASNDRRSGIVAKLRRIKAMWQRWRQRGEKRRKHQ